MSVDQHGSGPDWGSIGGAVVTTLTAVGGAFAAWSKWGKEKREGKQDYQIKTLDGVFALVDQLQEVIVSKAEENAHIEQRYRDYSTRMERRVTDLEALVEEQANTISTLRREIRELREGRN